jgi:tetratricopeptide (TPR) repeat protein
MKGAVVLGCIVAGCAVAGALASSYSDFNAAIAAHDRGDWGETIRLDNAALAAPDLMPGFRLPALIDRGDAHAQQKEWAPAEADYGVALSIAPDNLEARLHRAAVYREEKKYDAAVADYVQVIRLRPNIALGYAGRAIVYDEQGNLDAAIADYTTIIGFEPRSAEVYALRGSAWRRKNAFDRAIADDDKAIDLDPNLYGVFFERAQANMDKGDYDEAVSDALKGVRLKPDDLDGRMSLGLAQWSDGDFAGASTTFGQLQGARPGFAYGALWRVLAAGHAGQLYEQQFAQDSAAVDKVKWPAPLIQLYLERSTPEAARAAAANADPEIFGQQICEANFYSGEWQLLHGQQAAARPMLEEALAKCPHEFVERDAAAAELARLNR